MGLKKNVLNSLSRAKLLEVASAYEIAGLSGKPKDEIARALAAHRAINAADLLDLLKRDDLKRVCQAQGLDDSGREKSVLIERILGGNDGADGSRRTDPAPVNDGRQKNATRAVLKMDTEPRSKEITQYAHRDKKRLNNPPVGLVTSRTEPAEGKKQYAYDPHLDPQLVWAGKAEHTSFDVDTVSLHVHERIDPKTIIDAVRKRANDQVAEPVALYQPDLFFDRREENPPLREAIEFYKHAHNWSNRLIAGDSLLVMNSLLEKEGMTGKIQMAYIDPPYGIKYGSNFQPFVNRREVKDGKDDDLNQEPEMVKAFRDTWELGIHSYLTYLKDRLILSKELLHESGSCFVQISDENLHLVRCLMDEVFGNNNFCGLIAFQKTGSIAANMLGTTVDYLIWYARDKSKAKYRQLYLDRQQGDPSLDRYDQIEFSDKLWRSLKKIEISGEVQLPEGRRFQLTSLLSDGASNEPQEFSYDGEIFAARANNHWKTTVEGLSRLRDAGRIVKTGTQLRYKRYVDDFPVIPLSDQWKSTQIGKERNYVVQTAESVIARCILMTTDPGDLVFDPTCGSGTTAYVSENWGRRWITCDTSRVAITLTKQRLMTVAFDYYRMAHPEEGIGSGFVYKTVPHVTLKSIANNPEIHGGMPAEQIEYIISKYAEQESLYDQPEVDNQKARVTGPFTVEAVPAPVIKGLHEIEDGIAPVAGDESVVRSGETLRQDEWRGELLKTGVRAKNGQMIEFSRVEPLPGTRWLHAEAETKGTKPQRVVVSFGPAYAPLEQKQVELAWEEARTLSPAPTMILFASFQFDPEAAKDIDELTPEKAGMTFLKVQMNTDLLTDDLKKKRSSNQSFWLIGQPDVELRRIAKGAHKGRFEVEVRGFDYYNPKTGVIESGDTSKIAMWMLDTDYDGRSLYPRQVFFPMAGDNEGWTKLAKNLRAEIDEELIEAYRGTKSLPFDAGDHQRIAVKIVDDRGIESLKIVMF